MIESRLSKTMIESTAEEHVRFPSANTVWVEFRARNQGSDPVIGLWDRILGSDSGIGKPELGPKNLNPESRKLEIGPKNLNPELNK